MTLAEEVELVFGIIQEIRRLKLKYKIVGTLCIEDASDELLARLSMWKPQFNAIGITELIRTRSGALPVESN